MEAELKIFASTKGLAAKDQDVLKLLAPGCYCTHKSWGFGRIASWNTDLGQVVIDFENKKEHTMDVAYAIQSLKPLSDDHVLVLASTNPDEVKRLASEDLAGLLRKALVSFGGSASQETLSQALAPALNAAALKKFWENAKRSLKKDGHFGVPPRKTDPWVLREDSMDRGHELLGDFKSAKSIKERITAADLMLKEKEAFANDTAPIGLVVDWLDDYARKHRNLKPPQAAEAVVLRDSLVAAFPQITPPADGITLAAIVKQEQNRLPQLFSGVPAVRMAAVIAAFPDAFGEEWPSRITAQIPGASGRLATELVSLLREKGETALAESTIAALIARHDISSDLMLWLVRERGELFPSLINAKLFTGVIGALERDQLNEVRKTRLQDYLMEDKEFVTDTLGSESLETVKDATRRLLSSSAVEEINKRSLMARILKLHPEVQKLLEEGASGSNHPGEQSQSVNESLVVSWESLEKCKAEYDDLVNKRIPDNSKQINIARSYGDLRENSEFKSAKEMQVVLLKRKDELEYDLARAQGTDFSNPDTNVVSIGTVAELTNLADGATEKYIVLGAWDSDPEKGIISYMTAIGQALIGKKPGEEFDLPTETGVRKVKLASVIAWKSAS